MNTSVLSKDLSSNAKKSKSYEETSKNLLCSLLFYISRNKQRGCFNDLKKHVNKINNAKKGLEIL